MQANARRGGFTLTELLVVVAIIGIILAIVLPVFFSVRARGLQTACLSNIRQISAGLLMYAQENDGFFPLVDSGHNAHWDNAVLAVVGDERVFRCPTCLVPPLFDTGQSTTGDAPQVAKGYAINAELQGEGINNDSDVPIAQTAIKYPASTVTLCEAAFRTGPSPNTSSFAVNLIAPDIGIVETGQHIDGVPGGLRHQSGSNYAFVDGHAKWYKPEQVRGANAGPNDGQNPSFAL